MRVELPSKFIYYAKNRVGHAYVRNNILYIEGLVPWEKLAYDLCYALHGKRICVYCGKHFKKHKMSVDHKFPRNFGGVSIPANLIPACRSCNSTKSNLNYYEYQVFSTMDEEDAKEYRRNTYRKKIKIRYSRGFDLPRKWISTMNIDDIIARPAPEDEQSQKKYKRVTNFVKNYNHLPNPIVVSVNNVLLEGNTVYWVAKDNGFEQVQVIVLENVFVML